MVRGVVERERVGRDDVGVWGARVDHDRHPRRLQLVAVWLEERLGDELLHRLLVERRARVGGVGEGFALELPGRVEADLGGDDDVAEQHVAADAAAGPRRDDELGLDLGDHLPPEVEHRDVGPVVGGVQS